MIVVMCFPLLYYYLLHIIQCVCVCAFRGVDELPCETTESLYVFYMLYVYYMSSSLVLFQDGAAAYTRIHHHLPIKGFTYAGGWCKYRMDIKSKNFVYIGC